MHYSTDRTWERPTPDRRTVLAGSPLRLFRLSDAGARSCDSIEAGDDVSESTLVTRLLDAGAIHPAPGRASNTYCSADVTIVTPQFGGTARLDRDVTVDDGSTPPIEGASIRLDHNRGPAAARNAGRRLVTSPLIAFVDADVSVDPGWLDSLIAHFDDPRVGLVAPQVVGDPTSSLDLGGEPARVRAGSRVSYVPAAAIVVRTTAFDDVGGFDEALRFGEDVDLVWRLDEAGWRCRYEPRSTVVHAARPTLSGRLRQQIGYGSAAGPLALRHPDSLAPVRMNRWMAAACVGVIAGRPALTALSVVGNAVSAHRLLDEIPRRRVVALVLDSHVAVARQLGTTIRRAWWPIAIVACVVSRRSRLVTLAAVLAGLRSTPTDVAYGWGVWRGMLAHRSWRPIVPAINVWEPDARRPRRSRRDGRARSPAAADR
jgi:mycofactocin system glycosyltransferase